MRVRVLPWILLFGLARLTAGASYVVDSSGTGDFPTIQAAIDAAADGDTVALEDGTFTGDGNRDISTRGKAIVVRSISGSPAACVIDAQGTWYDQHRGFVCTNSEGPNTVLEGFTIMRGFLQSMNDLGGTDLGPPTCSPRNGSWRDRDESLSGGGVLCGEYTAPTVRNCVFYRNRAASGAGLALGHGAHPAVIDCEFRQNYAGDGGGIGYVTRGDSTAATVTHCTFVANEADVPGHGAGAAVTGLDRFTDCTFTQNRGGWGGGFFTCGTVGPSQFVRCTIADNFGPGAMT